jgi:hypothetical protein
MDAAAGARSTVSPFGHGGGQRDRLGHHRLSVVRDDLEERQFRRVSSERRDERRPVDADHDRGTQALDVGRDERVRVDTLEQAADDPHDPAEGAQRRLGRVRVGGLRVVDPADAAGHRHRLDAVRVEAEVAERVVDDPDGTP